MASSARNGSRHSARETRRTIPVLPATSTIDDHTDSRATEEAPPADPAIAANNVAEVNAVVPRGLQVAAAWSWRAILVAALLWGIVWLARYLSEVLIPVAVAILLTALMLPVARMLRKWGLPKALATAITVLGAVASIVGVLIVIGGQIAGQGPELSTNVVSGFNKLSDWLSNGPLTNWLRNGPLHINATWLDSSTWVTKVTDFLKASGSTIATYAAEFGASVGHFFAGLALALFSLFYFIYDGRGIFSFLLNFIPRLTGFRR